MKSLATAFKLNFKLLNPYIIKPQFQILSNQINQTTAKLIEKNQLNYDSYILRFQLPEQNKCLGLKIGQHVEFHLNGQKKNYVPISRIDDPGTVDILVRDMSQKVGTQKSFSKKIVQLKEGSNVTIKGPKTSYIYHGYGKIQTQSFNKKFKRIGIIAYQTGITATYSLIQSIYANQDNQTAISLLWIGSRSQDFVFLDQLSFIVQQSKLSMNLMLSNLQKGFPGPFGQIDQNKFKQYLPPPSEDTVLFLAGTTQQVNNLRNISEKLGYKYIV